MSAPNAKTTRIELFRTGTAPNYYWDESRRDWVYNGGTRYRTIQQAQEAIKRFKLFNCRVVSHG